MPLTRALLLALLCAAVTAVLVGLDSDRGASKGTRPTSRPTSRPPTPLAAPALAEPTWARPTAEQRTEALRHAVPVAFENELGQRFVLVPAGQFVMGSPADEPYRDGDEFQHEVMIKRPFYMQVLEVAANEYARFDPKHGSAWIDPPEPGRPVRVDPRGARHFAAWLSTLDGKRLYRLPTEVEWEYACRAGTETSRWWGADGTVAWRYENLAQDLPVDAAGFDGFLELAPGGHYPPNPWGLHDMLGNVVEFCSEVYDAYPGADRPARDRSHAIMNRRKGEGVLRGASCRDHILFARSAWRDTTRPKRLDSTPPRRWPPLGFRLVSPLPPSRSAGD